MAVITPFRGLTYNLHTWPDLSNLVAPPYDVISEKEQDEYYRTDEHNVIRLILGKQKPGDSDWDNRYTRAAEKFKRWESEKILVRADKPCIYLTSLTYNPGNGNAERTRWGIIALARIEDRDSGIILPHERTFSAHKDDRLKLMRACNAQFSQIFGLYEEPDNTLLKACKEAAGFKPNVAFEFRDGTKHEMWILQEPSLFKYISEITGDKQIFIADGHHRYETALNYRNIMRPKYGRQASNRSYEYVMMYLSNMSDRGLTILPTHRLIKKAPDFDPDVFLEKAKSWFTVKDFPFSEKIITSGCREIKSGLEKSGIDNTAIAFYHYKADKYYILSLKPEVRKEMGGDLHPSLQKLDVLVLSRFILQRTLGFSKEDLDDSELIHYQSSMVTSISQVMSGKCQMVFLLNPTKIEHVKEIAGNSLVMPRKSTFFFPKILTGLVFNKIDPDEIIQRP
ncbi:MAG TPA: DUF1015 domain-containing protein [Desulfobacteraceae bacterium]|nr:DUF1015 domain-containing protein [Desulfobacteraceae bacterium]HPJ66581.1 DUF1015 domain-containing protein [Desulfobacteraceae bacterium]HPQ28807.1 DUF1015 domain-containing protein [Desulfobacteraceae bacterium]